MIKEFEGILPNIDAKVYIAEGAHIIGAVEIKEFSNVWHNVVIRGDVNKIEIGKYSNIQDNSVVHGADDNPTIIGDYVTVGHGSILHGCVVEEHCLIGMGVIVLNGAVIGKGSIVAAGTVVVEETKVPPRSLVIGIPGKITKSLSDKYNNIHAQAIKYKTLWTQRYKIIPNCGGEVTVGRK